MWLTRAAANEPSSVKVSYTLSESIKQLSKKPDFVPFVNRPDWHAAQLLLVVVFVGAYIASWSTDEVALVVRHHRLETFDKRRIMMLFRDERVRMLAAESQPHLTSAQANEVSKLREELQQVQLELSSIKTKLADMRNNDQRVHAPRLLHALRLWVPKVDWAR
eukprot:jgi/Ulvmu1/4588/UM002_0317.1